MAFKKNDRNNQDDRTIKKIRSLLGDIERQPLHEQRKRIERAQMLLSQIQDPQERISVQRNILREHLRHLTPEEIEEAKQQGISEEQARKLMKVKTRQDRINERISDTKTKKEIEQRRINKLLQKRIEQKQQEYSDIEKDERDYMRKLPRTEQERLAGLISQLQETEPSDSDAIEDILAQIAQISPVTEQRIRTETLTQNYQRMLELRKKELPSLQKQLKSVLRKPLPSQYTDQEAINLAEQHPEYRPTGDRAIDAQRARNLLTKIRREAIQQITSDIEDARNEYETFIRSSDVQQDLKKRKLLESSLPEIDLERHEGIKIRTISKDLPRKRDSFDQHVDRILKGRTIEEILDIDTADLKTEQVITKYEQITEDLLKTPGPKAREAQKKLERIFAPIVDYIAENPDTNIYDLVEPQKLKEITADYNRHQVQQNEYYRHPSIRDAYKQIPEELRQKLTLEHMRQEDMKRRQEALKAIASTGSAPIGILGSATYTVGKFFGSKAISGATTTGRLIDETVLESNPIGRRFKSTSNRIRQGFIRFSEWTTSGYDQMSEKILSSRVINRKFTQYDRIKSYDSINALKLESKRKKSIIAHYQNLRKKKGKKAKRLNPLTLIKATWDILVQPQINRIQGAFHAAREFVATYSGFRRLLRINSGIGNKIVGVKTTLMSGRIGRTLIRANRALNGVRAIFRATTSGLKTGGLTLITGALLTGGLSAPVVALGAVSGLAGFGSKIISDTLNSKVLSPIKWIAEQQQRFGIAKYIDIETGQFTQNFLPKSKVLMISNSISEAIYGANIGYLAGMLIPWLDPFVGAVLGAAMFGGTKFASQWIVNKILMKISNISSTSWLGRFINVVGTMPVFSAAGLITSIPWLDNQIRGIKERGFDFIKDQYFNLSFKDLQILNTSLNWLNQFSVIISSKSFTSWAIGATGGVASGSFVSLGTGIIVGMLTGGLIASSVGLSIGTGAIIGGVIGGAIGGAIGSTILPGLGTFIGSFIGSTVGTIVGSIADTALERAREIDILGQALSTLLGALSFFKGIFDFFRTLTERFDASKSIAFALTLLFGLPVLTHIVNSNSILTNPPDDLNEETTQIQSIKLNNKPNNLVVARDENFPIQGESSQKEVIDCLKTKDLKIYNPKRSIITKIQKNTNANNYTIHTKDFVFENIHNINLNLEKYSTVNSQVLIGDCQ